MLIADYFHKDVWVISQNATIKKAIEEMIEKRSNSLVAVDEEYYPVGIITIQDIASNIVPKEFVENSGMAKAMYKHGFFDEQIVKKQNTRVSEIMRTDFTKIDLNSNTLAILADFLKSDLYTIPILDGNHMIGVVTRSDIKKAFAKGLGIDFEDKRNHKEKNNDTKEDTKTK